MVPTDYAALTSGAGLLDFGDRTQLELTGEDRAAFLHNLCTNDIRKLVPGSGCEAFLLNVQGKIVGHVLVFCRHDSLVLETVPGQADILLGHLDRYLIRERVELHDRSHDWAELLLAGAEATTRLSALGLSPPENRLAHVDGQLAGESFSLRAVDVAGSGSFLLSCRRASPTVRQALLGGGFAVCEQAALEAVRIEAGWPFYGRDITSDNLPQEVARDARAISFVKGCYLGQETVARIDALGHVNRTLVGLRFGGGQVPAAGLELSAGGKTVATVTSAAFSPKLSAPLALAYVRRGHNATGQTLDSTLGPAEVVTLPV